MSKLLSTQVKVYPTAYRGLNDTGKAYNPESRLNTEYNITNTTKSITEKRNFVISWDNSTETVLFSIQGYYFEANVNNVLSGDKLYAAIKVLPLDATVDEHNIKYPAYTLVPFDTDPSSPISSDVLLDANGDFLGLNFSNSDSLGGAGVYSIQLLEKVGGVWRVPTKSLFITDTSRVEDKETGESVTKHFTSEEITAEVGNIDTLNITSSITGADFGDEVVIKRVNITNKAVDTSKLEDDAVTTGKIKDDNITESKIASDSIISVKIKDGAVTSAKIGTGEVKTGNIADSAVTAAKLNANAVTNAKIENNAVTSEKIKAGEITGGTSGHLASSTITNSNIVDGTIENIKLKNSSITVGGGSVSLGGTITKDTILGVSHNGIIARTNDNTYINTYGDSGTVLISTGGGGIRWTQPYSQINGEGIRARDAVKLVDKRKIWGNDFDGTDNISGGLSNVGNVSRNISSGTYNIGTSDFPFTNIYSTNFYATSDERLKEDIKEFKYEKSVLDIPVKTFRYRDNPEKEHIGFIAQDLQKYFPELVTSGEEGYLSINENKLVYLLIEEVKQLKVEVEKLRR